MANIFSKRRPGGHPGYSKKILIILVVVLAAILLLGIAAYRYLIVDRFNVQNSVGGVETEIQENVPENNAQEVKIEPETGLFICADKCGDNICQTSDPECQDSMNCICPENQQECSQDCK